MSQRVNNNKRTERIIYRQLSKILSYIYLSSYKRILAFSLKNVRIIVSKDLGCVSSLGVPFIVNFKKLLELFGIQKN